MATWKKLIVSGSAAELLNVTASAGLFSTQLNVGTTQQITNNPATTFLSGSFSGSFTGNVNINLADLTQGNGIVAFSYDGNSAQTVTLDTGSTHFTEGVREKLSATAYLGYNQSTGNFTFDSGSYGTFAAGAGLTSTNGILAVGAGTGITVNADDVAIDTTVVVRKYATTITPANPFTATTFEISHGLGTLDIEVAVYEVATGKGEGGNTNVVTIGFAVAPIDGETYRVVVQA
jgi:hypothetical protein